MDDRDDSAHGDDSASVDDDVPDDSAAGDDRDFVEDNDDSATREEVLELLCENARHSVADLARLTGASESTVEAAIADLEDEGVVQGYTAIVDWDAVDDERVRAHVECNVTLDRETSYDDVAERLAGFPEVEGLQLVSGDYDFAMAVEGDNMREVSRFISDKVAPLPEITQTVTHYVMETYKQGGYRFRDGGDDDRLSVTP